MSIVEHAKADRNEVDQLYYVYMLRCADGTIYTGMTNDVSHRMAVHNAGKGAKYTRSRLPVSLLFSQACCSRSDALIKEAAIKKMTRKQKEDLVQAERLEIVRSQITKQAPQV